MHNIASGLALFLMPVSAFAAAQRPTEHAAVPAVAEGAAARVADLIRLWTYVRLFDIDRRAMTGEWEAALNEAAKPALDAKNDSELGAVATRMMAHIDLVRPKATTANAPAVERQALTVVNGQAIASCAAIGKAAAENPLSPRPKLDGDADAFNAAAKRNGIIFDCRGFPSGQEGGEAGWYFTQASPAVVSQWLGKPVDRGAMRVRLHDGYPPDQGGTSGGYTRGVYDQAFGLLKAAATGVASRTRIVFLSDPSSPDLSSVAGGLQASGKAQVLSQGRLSDDYVAPFESKHVHALVTVAQYVAPNGRAGFRPNGCFMPDASETAVLKTAVAALHGAKAPTCSPVARVAVKQVTSSDRKSDPAAVPSLGERMVALAKLWGTFEYFHPYKDLNDRSWESELEEFVPIFAAANTRASYEEAVKRLAARANDSHVQANGLKAAQSSAVAVPLYVQPVEGRFAVAGINDPTLATQVRIGDEILAVDGKPARDIAASFTPFIAASTPQWLAQRQAGLLLRGPKESSARLTLRRGDALPFDVVAPRSLSYVPRPKPDEASFHRIGSDIGYIDLDRLAPADADRAMDELMNTRAIIFDLRGYPQGTGWTIAPRLALPGRDEAVDALFRRPIYMGPNDPQQEWKSSTQHLDRTDKPHYRGKVIVLIDARAISQSEHTAMMFEAAANPIFVGTPTAGANGDVTNVELPGGLLVYFTGHDVRHADGRQLQRIGIQPNVRVAPTFKGMQSGHDEVLEAGLAIARQP